MTPLHVVGVGLWSPGFADVAAWRDGRRDPRVEMPRCRLVGSRLRRGASRFALMLGEVVEQAGSSAGVDLATTPTIYTSSLGEIETMATLLRMLFLEDGKLSPNRFKNSVHNAASGLVSIATGSTAFSTALAGGARSFEVGVLEAWAYLEQSPGPLILAVGDDRPPPPLSDQDDYPALAVAFCLTAHPPEARPRIRLTGLRRLAPGTDAPSPPTPPAAFAPNAAGAALPLLHAVVEERSGWVSLAPAEPPPLPFGVDVVVDG
ncbi:MAG: beta-ketoacyl synthase chain length factor [Sandaracinaceae bacterium]